MPIEFEDTPTGVRVIRIAGRMDIAGTGEIETRFATMASSRAMNVVVDLSAVDFLASIGIRSIIANAKAQQARGGKLVLLVADNKQVASTLETTGIDVLVPMHPTLDGALSAFADDRAG